MMTFSNTALLETGSYRVIHIPSSEACPMQFSKSCHYHGGGRGLFEGYLAALEANGTATI